MQGFRTYNTRGEVLISSNTPIPHFENRGIYVGYAITGNTFIGWGGSYEGSVIYYFHTHSGNVPMSFIRPTVAGAKYAILYQTYHTTYWEVAVIQSTTTVSPPSLYVFSNLPGRSTMIYGFYGLKVVNAVGDVMFNNTSLPLGISTSIEVSSPAIPCNSGIPPTINQPGSKSYYMSSAFNTIQADFNTNSIHNTYTLATPIPNSALMFYAPAKTQACYEEYHYASYKSTASKIEGGSTQYAYKSHKWAMMYHQGFVVTNSSVTAGWCMYFGAYQGTNYDTGSGGFGISVGPIDLGGGTSGSTNTVSGKIPYTQKTINETPTNIVIADSRNYD